MGFAAHKEVNELFHGLLRNVYSILGILLDIKLNWENILDANLNSVCFAHSLKKINNKNILTISSDQNNILELSYSSDTIKEKINKFYNSPIIDEIKFKKFLQN